MELFTANLSYAITQDDETLSVYAIEQQIRELDAEMDEMVRRSKTSGADPKHFRNMIRQLCDQMTALREQLEIAKTKTESNADTNYEIERIKQLLSEKQIDCNDITLRRLVQYIRVMEGNRLIIVLKGVMQIEERINFNKNIDMNVL